MNNANLKPWFSDDILRFIASVYYAGQAQQKFLPDHFDAGYYAGFDAALKAMAIMFGVLPEQFDAVMMRKAGG